MAYELEEIRVSQEIFYYLLEHHELREEDELILYKAYTEQEEEKSQTLENQIREGVAQEGALKSKVEAYNHQEEQYNGRYGAPLTRKIRGEYEPGTIEILRETYVRELEEVVRERIRKKKARESTQEEIRRLDRSLENLRALLIRKRMEQEQKEAVQAKYEKELDGCRIILKYLDLDEKILFDTKKILQVSKRKLPEIAGVRRKLEKEEDILQKEFRQLTQGKTLEFPEELEKELAGLGIHVVYGMEWLGKNGYSEEKNRELVKQHPFLPYALILSRQELEKLRKNVGDIYTSFPVPVIVREELAEKKEKSGGNVISLAGVSFYVLFNENLLNEEKLRLMVQEKERQIHQEKEAISVRQREYEEYFKRQEVIENQEVGQELYEGNLGALKELRQQIEESERELQKVSETAAGLRMELEHLEEDIREADRKIEDQKRRSEDFEQLAEAYRMYGENRAKLERCQKQVSRLIQQQKLAKERLAKLREDMKTLQTGLDLLVRDGQEFLEKLGRYEKYEFTEEVKQFQDEREGDGKAELAEKMEIRFLAITGSLSIELQELESQEIRARKRYETAVDELEHLRVKYGLKTGEWEYISYSRKEESHQEILLTDCQKKAENRRMLWVEEDKQIAVIGLQMKDRTKQMMSGCGQEKPLAKAEIQGKDFEGMSGRELRNFKGILIRDYNQSVRDRQQAKERLVHVLNQIVRMDVFQEEFYRKPLESMLELTDDAEQVLRQLGTTIQSYDSLMEKLEVDISLVEKEKNKIVERLEEYIREVHLNLGKIDHNSTISIREKPVKMLKIQLPGWEENENLYHIRLQDMIDEVTQKGIGIFERNENAQEYFGTRITTRNLYDTVIGIGNVQIRLYKVEEMREYPITWAEVARNSGGEGFLSAFVILSSLLYYMRKDDTDIFADRNEGKVLLMDNPFAQTNAAHLLKPLMDMAKKTNTQLICLTGLGGESIYNRFDNIYVLNLIAARLRSGMQYLKADHLRGNEPEVMVVSQIEVMEQQELVF